MLDHSIFEAYNRKFQFVNNNGNRSRFLCKECGGILIEPYQTECGSRLCYFCTEKLIDNATKCPGCDKEFQSFEKNITRDKAMDRQISKLQFACINENCKEIIFFKDLENHLKICNYRRENCEKCDGLYLVVEKQKHVEENCLNQLITCRLCQVQLMKYEMERVHNNVDFERLEDLCEFIGGNCPFNCCDTSFKKIKMHLQKCPKRPIKCLMWMIGCPEIVSRETMDDHIKNDGWNHQNLLMKYLLESKHEYIDIKSQLLKNQNSLSSKVEHLKESSFSLHKALGMHSQNIHENDEVVQNLRNNFQSVKKLSKSKCFSQNTISSQNVGEVIWTITNISEKIKNARKNVETQIICDAFYTNIPGYKMKLKIYPNGDGKFKNQYLSVFFIILKGEYDDQLSWPFSKKITMCLLKEDIPINSTKVIIKPNLNQACYGKPINGSNVGSGEPAFVNINDLINSEKYSSNGNLCIKFNVEE